MKLSVKLTTALAVALVSMALPAVAVATPVTSTTVPDNNVTVTPGGGTLTATGSDNAVLTTDFPGAIITCSSAASGTVDAWGTGTLTALSFTTCSSFIGTCTVTVDQDDLPRTATADSNDTGSTAPATGTTEGGEVLNIHGTVTATINCPGTSFDCTVGATNPSGDIDDSTDPTTVTFDELLMVNSGSAACTSPRWQATYQLTIEGETHPTITRKPTS